MLAMTSDQNEEKMGTSLSRNNVSHLTFRVKKLGTFLCTVTFL